jgi:hypothetical protein
MPCASAKAATDTPGCLHSSTRAGLAVLLYVQGPFVAGFKIKPSTRPETLSVMVSTKSGGRHP